MSQSSEVSASMENLSALVDGELVGEASARACGQWRDDGQARAAWHAYALIGDVLRSGDLASDAGHDCAFLTRLRARLADEPVVLAPAAPPAVEVLPAVAAVAAGGSRRAWRTPVAVAAGFMVVAGALVATSVPGSLPFGNGNGGAATVAQGTPVVVPAAATGLQAVSTQPAEAAPVRLNGQLIRDARLDEYLSVHKKFGGSSAPGVPSGFLRNAAAEAPAR